MNRFEYAVSLKSDGDGFVVTCRDLPALITQGDNEADALCEAADAMDEVFAVYMKQGLTFPAPSKAKRGERMVAPPAETIAKAALHTAMDEKEVRRLLDLHYGSKLPRIAEAISLLGKKLVIGLEPA